MQVCPIFNLFIAMRCCAHICSISCAVSIDAMACSLLSGRRGRLSRCCSPRTATSSLACAGWPPNSVCRLSLSLRSFCLLSFAFMTCIIACYQILISARSAPASVVLAVAAHHVSPNCWLLCVIYAPIAHQALFPCLVHWLAQDPNTSSLRAPPFHLPCAALATLSAILLPRKAETAQSKKTE